MFDDDVLLLNRIGDVIDRYCLDISMYVCYIFFRVVLEDRFVIVMVICMKIYWGFLYSFLLIFMVMLFKSFVIFM